jgi:hypothetical protein
VVSHRLQSADCGLSPLAQNGVAHCFLRAGQQHQNVGFLIAAVGNELLPNLRSNSDVAFKRTATIDLDKHSQNDTKLT